VPGAEFRAGRLESLPFPDGAFDLVVCALALAHCPDLRAPIAELARVLRRGGRLVVSDLHPFNVILGGGALFQKADGTFGLVRSFPYQLGEYVAALVDAGVEVRRCLEPPWSEEHVPLLYGPLFPLAPEGFRAASVGLPGALVLEGVRR
jgi:SAM-dependent methyltransferase